MLKRRSTSFTRQLGFSLVELMVGLVVGLLIVAAAGSSYITNARTGRDAINSAKLNIELRGAMDVMSDEIRRAGASAVGGRDNPFMNRVAASRTDLQVSATCVEFAFDTDGNGVVATAAPYEYTGFQVVNGAIQIRNGGAGVVANCANGSWENLTDPSVVTIVPHGNGANYFVLTYQCLNSETNVADDSPCAAGGTVFDAAAAGSAVDLIETRTVTINVGARLVSDTAMQMQLSQRVLVRNHRVVVAGT